MERSLRRSATATDPYGLVVDIHPDDSNPAYHGIGTFTGEGLFRGFGTTMVMADTTLPQVEVFASNHAKNIVVLNMDQSATQNATFSLSGASSGSIEVWRKDELVLFPDPPVKLASIPLENGTFTYKLPPSFRYHLCATADLNLALPRLLLVLTIFAVV